MTARYGNMEVTGSLTESNFSAQGEGLIEVRWGETKEIART